MINMKWKGLLFLFFLLFLTACGNNGNVSTGVDEMEDTDFEFENAETGQTFEVVHAYTLYDSYFEEIKDVPNDGHLDVYKSTVVDPIFDACFADGEFVHLADGYINDIPKNRIALQDVIKRINTKSTNEAIQDALLKSSNLLATEGNTVVCVFPSSDTNTNVLTIGSGKILITYNRNYTNDILKSATAHGYLQSVWASDVYNGESLTVLDHIVLGGKAVKFEKEVFPNIEVTKVNPEFSSTHWNTISKSFDTVDDALALKLLNGGSGLPSKYGYSEGYKIVDAFVEQNANMPVDEWLQVAAADMLEQSNYGE